MKTNLVNFAISILSFNGLIGDAEANTSTTAAIELEMSMIDP